MKTTFLLLLLFVLCVKSQAQTIAQMDSLNVEICKEMNLATIEPDTAKARRAFETHLFAFFRKHNIDTEEKANPVIDRVYFRLQKDCPWFQKLLAKEAKTQDWEFSDTKPVQKIKKKQFRQLKGNFYYDEPGASPGQVTKTKVVIDDKHWTETFADGSQSKCKFGWTDDCNFTLEFIESSNHTRKNLSVKGDKYFYGVFDQLPDGTLMCWCRVKETDPFQVFKMYPEK